MKKIVALCCFLLLVHVIIAQKIDLNQGGTTQTNYFSVIPYENVDGTLIIKVDINGKTRRFIFDTGAPNIISKALFDELNPEVISKIPISDQSGKKDSMVMARVSRVTIGNLNFDNVPALLTDNENYMIACFNVDGFIGSNLLRNSIVRISSVDKTITLTDDKTKLPLKKKQSSKLFLTSSQSSPYIWVTFKNKKTFKEQVLFDSGDSRLYVLTIAHFDLFKKRDIFQTVKQGQGNNTYGMFGTANDTLTYRVRIPQADFNDAILQNIVAETTGSSDSRVGSKLLDYGIATLDYKNKLFYFEPFNETVDAAEKKFKISPTMKNNQYVIGIIWDKELEKEISVGDQIIAINGVDYSNVTPCDLIGKVSPFEGKDELTVGVKQKNGNIKEITLIAE